MIYRNIFSLRLNFRNFQSVHSVEKREIHTHHNIFREINSLVTFLENPVLTRNFVKTYEREFRTVWKNEKFTVTQKEKNRQINSLVFSLQKRYLHKIFVKKV